MRRSLHLNFPTFERFSLFRLLSLCIGFCFPLCGLDLEPFKKDPHWDYQTIIVNGEVVHHSSNWSGGSHVIFDRYAAVKKVLNYYKRPFKILDIGANNGFFGIKVAEDFDSVSVLVDRNNRLTSICEANTDFGTLIYLKKSLNLQSLKNLLKEEHFDCIFAFHVLHHQKEWKEWIDVLLQLGDNLIIETPSVNDLINKGERTKEIARYVTQLPGGVPIGSFSRGRRNINEYDHMIWFCQNPSGFDTPAPRVGILVQTFLEFGGAFPNPEYVRASIPLSSEIRGTSSL